MPLVRSIFRGLCASTVLALAACAISNVDRRPASTHPSFDSGAPSPDVHSSTPSDEPSPHGGLPDAVPGDAWEVDWERFSVATLGSGYTIEAWADPVALAIGPDGPRLVQVDSVCRWSVFTLPAAYAARRLVLGNGVVLACDDQGCDPFVIDGSGGELTPRPEWHVQQADFAKVVLLWSADVCAWSSAALCCLHEGTWTPPLSISTEPLGVTWYWPGLLCAYWRDDRRCFDGGQWGALLPLDDIQVPPETLPTCDPAVVSVTYGPPDVDPLHGVTADGRVVSIAHADGGLVCTPLTVAHGAPVGLSDSWCGVAANPRLVTATSIYGSCGCLETP